jgi:hypothetical protein
VLLHDLREQMEALVLVREERIDPTKKTVREDRDRWMRRDYTDKNSHLVR